LAVALDRATGLSKPGRCYARITAANYVWGAHAPRVLAIAPRDRELCLCLLL
jgi:hypothetical protein